MLGVLILKVVWIEWKEYCVSFESSLYTVVLLWLTKTKTKINFS